MKVLLTGSTGVIGKRLLPLLRDAGHEVTAVVRSPAGQALVTRLGASPMAVDLFNPAAVLPAVTGRDVVVNMATHIPSSSVQMLLPWAWRENDRLRTIASATLVDACTKAGVPRFVQESFAPVYPNRGEYWIDETVPIAPVRYNRSIADAEASAERFSRAGRTGVVLRFGAFYGPDALQTLDMIKLIRKGWAAFPGPPDAYISSVSHDDAASAVAAALTLPAGVYNVVDDEPVTHREYFESLAGTLGVAAPRFPPAWMTPLFGPFGTLAARSLRISNRKLRDASGWRPRFPSVREGWRDVVARTAATGHREREPGHGAASQPHR
jgi:nucleoside-diphosphate-sugar epimerase